jgi:hypothetical protein
MTAAQIAELLHARRSGTGRWMARCPAHGDKTPSLSIREAPDGRTLIHCHAGCGLMNILEACSLHPRELFAGPPPSAETRKAVAERQKREHQKRQQQRLAERAKTERVRRYYAISNELFSRAARQPDGVAGDKMAELAHRALDRAREIEAEAEG